MRVLIYEGDGFLGSHIADRFQKEGHDVVCLYTRQKGMGTYPVTPHTKYRYNGNLSQLDHIIRNERPHVVVVCRDAPVTTISALQTTLVNFTQLLDASVQYNVPKLIYLSDISVYGTGKDFFTEADNPAPETIDAKCHILCEECATRWRYNNQFSTVILRTSEVYGQRQDISSRSIVWKMIRQAVEKRIDEGLNSNYSILYSGDVVDAVYKSIGDYIDGVFNITPDETTSGNELAETVACLFGLPEPATQPNTKKCVNADNSKAKRVLGYVNLINAKKGVEHCCLWYKHHPQTKNEIATSKTKSDKIMLIRYLETFLFFFIAALITYSQTGWHVGSAVNFLTLYIIVIAISFGTNHAILAAVLASIFNIFSSMMSGMSLVTSLYDLGTMLQVVENLLIGISIGYVVDRKDSIIAQKDKTLTAQTKDLDYINQLYDEMGEVKAELEMRITEYEDSYGKIYHTIKKLDSLAPEEVFINSLGVIRELMHENNISLYLIDKRKMFMRRIAFIGEETKLLPRTLRLKDFPKVNEIVKKKELYANSFMDTELPSMIVPITYDENVVSLVVIDKMHFDKLTLYHTNLMRIVANLINSAFNRAQEYEQIALSNRYIKDTPILKPTAFEKEIALKTKLQETSNYEFCVLEIIGCRSIEDIMNKAYYISRMIRSNDDIGKTVDNRLGLLLSATSETESVYVVKRLMDAGIASRLVRIRPQQF